MKKLGIIGCGWLGKKIGLVLQDKFEIFATTTSKEFELFSIGFTTKKINFDEKITINRWEQLDQLDILILAIPFSKKMEEG